jgi:hypothetical protein
MTKFKLFGELQKAEKQEDGTLIVSGIASSEAVDSAGETIKASAIKAALPDYMAFGAVREMHQPIAVGVALKCDVDLFGKTHIEAKIVDPVSIKKVEEGVLKGFSVGGKITDRDTLDKTIITGIKLTEISLVDRPCNPDALVNLCKLDDEDEDEKDKKKKSEDDDDSEDSEETDDKKEKDDDAEKLAKLGAHYDHALATILSLQSDLKKVQSELSSLKKAAAPPKGVLKSVSKGQDVNNDVETDLKKQAELFDSMSPTERAAALIRIIHGRR